MGKAATSSRNLVENLMVQVREGLMLQAFPFGSALSPAYTWLNQYPARTESFALRGRKVLEAPTANANAFHCSAG